MALRNQRAGQNVPAGQLKQDLRWIRLPRMPGSTCSATGMQFDLLIANART